MTLNFERKNSLLMTKEFLRDLLDPKKTPRVPANVRKMASICLRHYPFPGDIEQLSLMCPEILGEKFEDNFKTVDKENE